MGWKIKAARAAAVFAVGKAIDRATSDKKRKPTKKHRTKARRRKK